MYYLIQLDLLVSNSGDFWRILGKYSTLEATYQTSHLQNKSVLVGCIQMAAKEALYKYISWGASKLNQMEACIIS